MDYLTEIASILFLLAMSAYFSASETAFSTLNRTRMKAYMEKGVRGSSLAYKLSEHYDRLLSTVLIGNNIVNIAMASISTVLFTKFVGGNAEQGAMLSTLVITVVVLVFGEISPKSIAKDCPENFSIFSAPLLQLLIWILAPVNFLFTCWKKFLAKLFRLQNDSRISQEELLMIVDEVEQGGTLNRNEGELLRNAIEFSDFEAKDILTPRVNLVALPATATREEIARVFSETKFSRLLIYEENIDNIIGVVPLKNFYADESKNAQSVKELIVPVVYTFAGEKISAIMRKLQQQRVQIAVVLDEFGGTLGIVTMEDVLEKLVGDIWDEHEQIVNPIRKVAKDVFQLDAFVSLADFAKFFDIKLTSKMASLNGWVLEHFQNIPQKGDSFQYENLTVTVLATEHRHVSLLEIRVAEKKQKEE